MYTSSVTIPPPNGNPYWSPLIKFEPGDTVYTLTVYVPQRPPKWYWPKRIAIPKHLFIRSDPPKPGEAITGHKLQYLDSKSVRIKSYLFPAELRCKHLAEKTECKNGCYILEKGGKHGTRWRCRRNDCQGHIYWDPVKKSEEGFQCFGKKDQRLVCLL